MAVSTLQLYVAFTQLFKTTEPKKKQVLQFGVSDADFKSMDMDNNEYLSIDEAMRNHSVSELLYGDAVSAKGSGEIDKASKEGSRRTTPSEVVDSINPNVNSGNNPFV